MKLFLQHLLLVAFTLCVCPAFGQTPTETYPDDPASVEQAGIPKGELLKFSFTNSRIFPGTQRDYWIYVPAQYKPDQPACVYVNQDGVQWKAPTVFDNLIAGGQMPVTIGVFVNPGWVRAANKEAALDRANRSFEYDGLGDAYARFLLEELLPDAEMKKTTDGRAIRLSRSGNDRAIGGSSSGAVCAFTAAWERPDAFSRVFSAIGTYVGLRGADRYSTLVRKYEPKPIRLFLQDGTNDLNIYGGDWWMANQTLERALTFNGYEVKHVWGEGAHNGKHGTAVFADAMRFLWQGWPKPVQNSGPKNALLASLLIPGEGWQPADKAPVSAQRLTVTPQGEVSAQQSIGKSRQPAGKRVVTHNGNVYEVITSGNQKAGKLHLLRNGTGKPIALEAPAGEVSGLCLSPDQTQLYVTESTSHWLWAYQIQPDGTLAAGQRFGWLHMPDTDDTAGAGDLQCDQVGNIYVATRLGIQVLDQLGRVNAIIPVPGGRASSLCFGDAAFKTVYVTGGGTVYRRKLNARGANSWEAPNKPEQGRL